MRQASTGSSVASMPATATPGKHVSATTKPSIPSKPTLTSRSLALRFKNPTFEGKSSSRLHFCGCVRRLCGALGHAGRAASARCMTPTEPPRNRAGANSPRPYHRSGLHAVSRTLPKLLEQVTDPALVDDALSPVERAARARRRDVLGDLGGADQVAAARVALLDAAVGSKIILDSIDRYLFGLAARDGLVNRRDRRAFGIVADRMRIADSLARQLQALGLERRRQDVPDLTTIWQSATARNRAAGVGRKPLRR